MPSVVAWRDISKWHAVDSPAKRIDRRFPSAEILSRGVGDFPPQAWLSPANNVS